MSYQMFFTASETECGYYQYSGKYEFTDELPNDMRSEENLRTPWN